MSAMGKLYYAVEEMMDSPATIKEILNSISHDYGVSEEYVQSIIDAIQEQRIRTL